MQARTKQRCNRPQHGRVRDQFVVAPTGPFRVGGLNDAAELDRKLDIGAHVLHAFGLVGVKQALRRFASDHVAQLPGEVGGVAQARAHALAEERRCLVRGIACQQQPVAPPLCRQRGMERVDDGAFDRGFRRIDLPWLEQLVDAFGARNGGGSSCGISMNSQRWRLPGIGMKVVGRAGSRVLDRVDDTAGLVDRFRHTTGRLIRTISRHDPAFM